MRHERLSDLLKLALDLAGNSEGLTVEEIATRLRASRRTAERQLAALREAFPALDFVRDGRQQRWRLPWGSLSPLLAPPPAELAELQAAAARLREEGAPPERPAALETLSSRIRAAMRHAALTRAEPDVEGLMLAQGVAARPGPRPSVPAGILVALRTAILACREVGFLYRPAGGEPRARRARPLGVLHGARAYLVASVPGTPGDPTLFRLDRMDSVALRAETFVPPPGFDLADWAGTSFGIWRDEPEGVVLRFSAGVAEEARAYRFHRTQVTEDLPDGRLLVRLTAGGRREMIHHLAIWEEHVEVLEPDDLRRELAAWARGVASHHRRVPSCEDDDADQSTSSSGRDVA